MRQKEQAGNRVQAAPQTPGTMQTPEKLFLDLVHLQAGAPTPSAWATAAEAQRDRPVMHSFRAYGASGAVTGPQNLLHERSADAGCCQADNMSGP